MDNLYRKIIKHLPLAFILVLAVTIRIIWIEKSPPSLNWDETALGYNAYSILETGNDEFGKFLPISLRSFDDYKPALYSYAIIPFIKIFGLTEVAVRLPSALAGTFSVLLIYLITFELLNKNKSLITNHKSLPSAAALMLAIEPWAIFFSRAAFEANLALAIYLSGIHFLIKSKFTNYQSAVGLTLVALSSYAYHAEKILLLPTILGFLILYRKNVFKNKKVVTLGLIFSVFTLIPLLLQTVSQRETLGRLGSTLSLSAGIIGHYLSYFSPVNLFVRGSPEPTQSIPDFGMFYSFEFIFWIFGIYQIAKNLKNNKELVFLMILFPIPAAITWNWFYPARVLPLFAIYSIVIAIGVGKAYDLMRNRSKIAKVAATGLLTLLVFINIANLITSLAFYLPYENAGAWQYGMKQLVTAISKNENDYKKVVVETKTAQPYIFFLFYLKYPPELYQKEVSQKPWIKGMRTEFDFGKYVFRDVYWPEDSKMRNTLFIAPESSLPADRIKSDINVNYLRDISGFGENLLSRIVGTK